MSVKGQLLDPPLEDRKCNGMMAGIIGENNNYKIPYREIRNIFSCLFLR